MNLGKFIYKNIDRIVYTSGFIGTWVYIKYSSTESESKINDITENIEDIKENINSIKELTINLKTLTGDLIKYHETIVKKEEGEQADKKEMEQLIEELKEIKRN